jgi:hypothetical protein
MEYVREKIRIEAPVGRVWAMVGSFGAMEPWCPAIKAMELEGHGIGSVRIAHLEGMVSREQLLEVDSASYKIIYSLVEPGALPLHNIRSTMQLFAAGPNATDILWYSEADEIEAATKTMVGKVVGDFYQECLAGLKQLLEKERKVRRLM